MEHSQYPATEVAATIAKLVKATCLRGLDSNRHFVKLSVNSGQLRTAKPRG
jgi:hypothetical protein